MIVKHQNNISIIDTARVNAKQWAHDNGPAIAEKIDRFFVTQAGSR